MSSADPTVLTRYVQYVQVPGRLVGFLRTVLYKSGCNIAASYASPGGGIDQVRGGLDTLLFLCKTPFFLLITLSFLRTRHGIEWVPPRALRRRFSSGLAGSSLDRETRDELGDETREWSEGGAGGRVTGGTPAPRVTAGYPCPRA